MSDLNSSIDELDFNQSLGDRQVRRVYLITYSQANLEEFPNCTVFTDKILEYFTTVKGDNNPPVQWACCQEPHKHGGKHYHLTIQFCVNKQTEDLSDLCSMAWNIDSAPQVLIQEKLPQLEKVHF